MNKVMTDMIKRKKINCHIYMRAVGYKKMLVNEEPSSPVFCRNENILKKIDAIRNEKLI